MEPNGPHWVHLVPNIHHSAYRTHHCILYSLVGWTSLTSRRMLHWYTFIYKAILGDLPSYICSKFQQIQNSLNLRSNCWLRYVVPTTRGWEKKSCLLWTLVME